VPAGTIALVATLSLTVLSDLEHNRVLRPSLVIQAYLFFTSLLDLARVRSQWLLDQNNVIAALVTVTLALKLILLAFESSRKYTHSNVKQSNVSPLERCGMFGRTLLLWVNPLLVLGYRQNLDIDDLFPLDYDLAGAQLADRLQARWAKSMQKRILWVTEECLPKT
jgi:ATP-binding cassette, subfamily C (CFTR/MRP), member 1